MARAPSSETREVGLKFSNALSAKGGAMTSAIVQQILGWTGIFFLGLLLARAVQQKMLRRYAVFYGYLGYVLVVSIAALVVSSKAPVLYWSFYWVTDFTALLFGLAITFDIFRRAFREYPGVSKLASMPILFLVVLAFTRLLAGSLPPQGVTMIGLERDLRSVQALMLVVFASLVMYYAVPIGDNLRGIAFGYGLFVSTSVLNLMLRAYVGTGFQTAWGYLQPLEYLGSEITWCVFLWSYAPAPVSQAVVSGSYESVSRQTEKLFSRLRMYMVGGESKW
jgi:hypothetical protein